MQAGNPARNVFARWRLEGDVPTAYLADAWNILVSRHASLRTSFAEDSGEPVQLVEASLRFSVHEIDLSLLPQAGADAEAERIASVEARTPFDISKAPLIRVAHVRLSARSSILMVTVHHIICDGWSLGILAREMGEAIAALNDRTDLRLPAIAETYAAYAQATRPLGDTDDFVSERQYLQTLLDGHERLELETDHLRSKQQNHNSEIVSILLDRSMGESFIAQAKAHHCTPFMLAYAILLVLLHKYSGKRDITLTTQITGRDTLETERIVGTFVNTLMLRTAIDEDGSFEQLLERVRDNVLDAFEMRHMPIRLLIAALGAKRDFGQNPLSSINFIFQKSFIENRDYGSFKLIDLPSRTSGAMFDLNVFMVERPEGWRLSCEFDVELYEWKSISVFLERFVHLIRTFSDSPARVLRDVSIMTEDDAEAIAGFNRRHGLQTEAPLFISSFTSHVAERPNAVAVECGKSSLTYRELDDAADGLRDEILRRSPKHNMRVGVLLDRSVDIVTSILAVLKSGGAFVLLDPNLDERALRTLMQAAQLSAIIAKRSPAADTIPAQCEYIQFDSGSVSKLAGAPEDQPSAVQLHHTACLVPALQENGAVRLVELTQRSIAKTVRALQRDLSVSHDDRFLAATTMSSDVATLELLLPLASGARLIVASDAQSSHAPAVAGLIDRHEISLMFAPSTGWNELLDSKWRGAPALRAVCVGPPTLGDRAGDLISAVKELWYGFGLPETGIVASIARAEKPGDLEFIAKPLAPHRMYLVDPAGDRVPPGVRGELTINGDCVGIGYLDDPELTAARFTGRDAEPVFRTGLFGRLIPDRGIRLEVNRKVRYTNADLTSEPATSAQHTHSDGVDTRTATEAEIFDLAAGLLGHDRFDLRDDLFTVGFHSLLAMKFLALLKEQFKVALPLRTVFEHPTVREIAARLEILREIQDWDSGDATAITTLNPTGTLAPFYFFHGDVASEGLYTRRLAALLGAAQPIHVVAAHGTAGLPALSSIEEMARDHVARIRTMQPQGPYRLSGFCLGGLVAYEIARILTAQGERVDKLVLINASALPKRSLPFFDGAVRGIALSLRLPTRLRVRLCYGLAWTHGALATGPISIVRFLRERLPTLIRPRESAWINRDEPSESTATSLNEEIAFAHVIASSFTYHPEKYAGKVTLIWGDRQNTDIRVPEREWRSVTGEVEALGVRGGHADLLNEHLENLSAVLAAAIGAP
ncbi:MAG: hypothetical protein NVSMB5_12630 [Candidatus Velthaea sp.]